MKVIIFGAIIICLYSCSSNDKKEIRRDFSKTLNSPPFDGLTDSINAFPDNVELRLRRAVLLSQNNLHSTATDDYKTAWQLSGDEGIALEYASNLLLAEKADEAISFLRDCEKNFLKAPNSTGDLVKFIFRTAPPEKPLPNMKK